MDGNKLSFSAFEDERNQAKGKDQSKGKGKAKPRKSRSTTNRCNSEESDQDQYWTSMEEYETDEDEGARRIPFRRTEKKGKLVVASLTATLKYHCREICETLVKGRRRFGTGEHHGTDRCPNRGR